MSRAGVGKQTTGTVEAIRQLRVVCESAVKSRSAATIQLGGLIVTAPGRAARTAHRAAHAQGQAAVCRKLRPDTGRPHSPTNAAKQALPSLARRIALLDQEITDLDAQLEPLVAIAAPRTTQLLGVSTGHAGQLLVTAGQNIGRNPRRERLRGTVRRQPDRDPPANTAATASTQAATAKPTGRCT